MMCVPHFFVRLPAAKMLRLPPLLPAAARDLLSDGAVQAYLLILGLAIRRCLQTYLRHNRSNPNPKRKPTSITTATFSVAFPLLLSATLLIVTWYLIFRFIFAHQHTSESYFDDAYKDVLRTPGHYAVSAQLLQWAIVAVVWSADEGGSAAFLLFGFLGAMSASFVHNAKFSSRLSDAPTTANVEYSSTSLSISSSMYLIRG